MCQKRIEDNRNIFSQSYSQLDVRILLPYYYKFYDIKQEQDHEVREKIQLDTSKKKWSWFVTPNWEGIRWTEWIFTFGRQL